MEAGADRGPDRSERRRQEHAVQHRLRFPSRPTQGEVRLRRRATSAAVSVPRRSYAGLVRTFQTPQVFQHLTVRENLMAGCYKQTGSGVLANLLGTPGSREDLRRMRTVGGRSMRAVRPGGGARPSSRASSPRGQQRLVELARAADGQAPLAVPGRALLRPQQRGGGPAHGRRCGGSTPRALTILLVSHDMDLVDVAPVIHVLCFGEIIASGPLERDPRRRARARGLLGV